MTPMWLMSADITEAEKAWWKDEISGAFSQHCDLVEFLSIEATEMYHKVPWNKI